MKHQTRSILPGQWIGIFGGGQLGRMFAMTAQRCGYRVVVFTPEEDSPASHVANRTIQASYEDVEALRLFAEQADVVTLEFENIQMSAVEEVMRWTPVFPGDHVLRVAQHRWLEKSFLRQRGFPVTPFARIESQADIDLAARELGWPMIWKTLQWGYDGKGQMRVASPADWELAEKHLGPRPWIAEQCIDLQAEVSLIVARNQREQIAIYPMFVNEHARHILDVTRVPCAVSMRGLEAEASEIAVGVAQQLELVGLLCIEFFIDTRGQLMINEIAPRPHNSGHLTIEACRTSQFEQQLRAVCNLPLGDVELLQPAAMVNLLGDLWQTGSPNFHRAFEAPNTFLHLYGKSEAKPGRKMGHLTCLDDSADLAAERARSIRSQLVYHST